MHRVSILVLTSASLLCACGSSDDSGLKGSGAGGGSAATGGGLGGGSAGVGGGTAGAPTGGAGGNGASGGTAGASGGSAGASGGTAGASGGTAGASGGTAGASGGTAGASGGTAGSGGGTGGNPTGGTGGGVVVDSVGCADGHREGYTNVANFPNVAACAGGFSVPGVKSAASFVPSCNRGAGDDGNNQSGTGCSVADLCSEGWHVCESGTEWAASGATGCTSASGFWASRQSTSDGFTCSLQVTAVNNVVGCGNSGSSGGCFGLNRTLRTSSCPTGWNCGSSSSSEALNVTKAQASGGGVLCCRIQN